MSELQEVCESAKITITSKHLGFYNLKGWPTS